jgi:hypothetical protein
MQSTFTYVYLSCDRGKLRTVAIYCANVALLLSSHIRFLSFAIVRRLFILVLHNPAEEIFLNALSVVNYYGITGRGTASSLN